MMAHPVSVPDLDVVEPQLLRDRISNAYQTVRSRLLAERTPQGYWAGELSSSALSTATAVVALHLVDRANQTNEHSSRVSRGLVFLAKEQNADGGWGDTCKSISNISTTMLAHAAFHGASRIGEFSQVVGSAAEYIRRAGGVPQLKARYGKDHTFSVPILTHCALCGLVDWKEIPPLPFELACLPSRFYKWVQLPVVSYALPALIAIGQAIYRHRGAGSPITAALRRLSVSKTLRVLERIQPESGGFLEATPLTSFVAMSLAGIDLGRHPVTERAVRFLVESGRSDGSWPIDSNLSTWVTTLSVNALGVDLPAETVKPIREWLLKQQHRTVHPYTGADPGGWAWTDLMGGVPDADDTPGALLALKTLTGSSPQVSHVDEHRIEDELSRSCLQPAVRWLINLQNRDGGWPTFCRGWGYLPFDRSSPDLTAHALRALSAWRSECDKPVQRRIDRAVRRGKQYLEATQQPDGSWVPLWFGNQHCPDDINPTYGTTRVLCAFRDLGWRDEAAASHGLHWLRQNQNQDGGWGGGFDTVSSVEETALAVDVLANWSDENLRNHERIDDELERGLGWLLTRVESGTFDEPSPIGFYFAKLWYFERLYPIIFTTAALRSACRARGKNVQQDR